MKRAIGALAIAGSIMISIGVAAPALAADIQGGEPSVNTSTTSPESTPVIPDPQEASADPLQTSTQSITQDTHSEDLNTEPTQPTENQVAGLKSGHSMASTPTTTSSQTQSGNSGDSWASHTPVTLCHKPGTPAEHTLTVDDDAVAAHLGHGDYLGECKVSTPSPTPTPTFTTPVGPPPAGVDSTRDVSYDCTTGFVTKTLTETPYTWIPNTNGSGFTKVSGTSVVTKTVRPIDPEEYTCPVSTPTPTPQPTTPTPTKDPSMDPTTPTPTSGTPTGHPSTETSPHIGGSDTGLTGSNLKPTPGLLANTGDNTGTLPAAGVTLVIVGIIALVAALILKRRRTNGS